MSTPHPHPGSPHGSLLPNMGLQRPETLTFQGCSFSPVPRSGPRIPAPVCGSEALSPGLAEFPSCLQSRAGPVGPRKRFLISSC